MDFEQLQRHLNNLMHEINSEGKPEFEGYSPSEMHQILNFTFTPSSPIKLRSLQDSDYKQIPIFNQVKYATHLIHEKGEIKLTQKGNLPTKIVSDIYNQGFLKDYYIEKNYAKLNKESDSMTISLTRIIIHLCGLTKKRYGKLSLTKKGEKVIFDNEKLFLTILNTYTTKFNWAYFDGYGDNNIGQLGFGFSLILLSKYGQKRRPDSFYAEKYLKAFPMLAQSVEGPGYTTLEKYMSSCYSLRTFERFMDYFGFININIEEKGMNKSLFITKTSLFDKIFECLPHSTISNTSYGTI